MAHRTTTLNGGGGDPPPLTASERINLHTSGQAIRSALRDKPHTAYSVYRHELKQASTPLVENRLRAVFEPHLEFTFIGESIRNGISSLDNIARAYHGARSVDRRALIRTAAEALIGLAFKAASGSAEEQRLREIGDAFVGWVLEGTVQQQVVCKLAIYLGLVNVVPPPPLADLLREQLIVAVRTVFEIGAPATTDIAVEALGATLKILPDAIDTNEWTLTIPVREGNAEINSWYAKRMGRRYLMAAAIAADYASQERYFRTLEEASEDDFDARSELIRALPAVWRQSQSTVRATTLERCVRILCDAARVGVAEAEKLALRHAEVRVKLAELRRLGAGGGAEEEAQISAVERRAVAHEAFARYQEAVFSTIGVMINRGAPPELFDDVVARAVERLHPTIAAVASEANAETRATVAIIDAAAKVTTRADSLAQQRGEIASTICEKVLVPRLKDLRHPGSIWANPGITEGLLRALPSLLAHGVKAYDALEGLRNMLLTGGQGNDLVALHRLVIANVCFRTLLTTLVDRMHERLLEFQIAADNQLYERDLDHAIAHLLAMPTVDNLHEVFRPDYNPLEDTENDTPECMSEVVIAAAVSDSELLAHMGAIYARWENLPAPHQLLLTRLLASELRAASHETMEIARYPSLTKRFDAIASVVTSNHDRQERLWRLLSTIPAQAADAADADIQDFVEHRSGGLLPSFSSDAKELEKERKLKDLADLPGYILAMIDESVSLRLARHIAREVDLKRRRAERRTANFDFAVHLYQVTLRGPSEAIFNHLVPRIQDPFDRALVSLVRRHVASVQADLDQPLTIKTITDRIRALLPDISAHQAMTGARRSPTLDLLATMLTLYLDLASSDQSVWDAIRGKERSPSSRDDPKSEGGFHDLLLLLDKLANDTHARHVEALELTDDGRFHTELEAICKDECAQLRAEVSHYVSLPISQFEERHRSMHHAIEIANRIEEKLREERWLQPPQQVLLFALLAHWRELFEQTKEWYVDAPRRCIETRRPEMFWDVYVSEEKNRTDEQELDRRVGQMIVADKTLIDRGIDDYLQEWLAARPLSTPKDLGLIGDSPPPIDEQRLKFERFYVDWMSAELDIDRLYTSLNARWDPWIRRNYFRAKNIWRVLSFIVAPFIVSAYLHSVDTPLSHSSEGLLFIIYAAIVLSATFYLLLRRPIAAGQVLAATLRRGFLRKLNDGAGEAMPGDVGVAEAKKEEVKEEDGPPAQYLFECILPSLFRLIIVPFVLLVEFEHSYTFPMEASNSVILLLMALAFLTTRYFVRREVMGHDAEKPLATHPNLRRPSEQARQIVALALTQSFALALIFSLMFESNTIAHQEARQGHDKAPAAATDTYHHKPLFLGAVPREAEANLGGLLASVGVPIGKKWQRRLDWTVYPTLVLTWTALGLFFGVFLEGFLRGARLRGEISA